MIEKAPARLIKLLEEKSDGPEGQLGVWQVPRAALHPTLFGFKSRHVQLL